MLKRITGAETTLERVVQRWINSEASGYPDTGAEGVLRDLMHGGCASGMVGGLIYYTDTVKFYKRHRSEIESMLRESMSDCGVKSPGELLRDWDDTDPFCHEDHNRNLLAWYGFEEAARTLANRNGIDL